MITCPACGSDNPDRYRLCGQCGSPLAADIPPEEIRRFATVVNSDLKGSTALGEKLDPESLREVLTRYFDEMRLVFESHGGTIEKIIGDAIVAVFGMPVRRDDDAIRAVEAAAESIEVLANLNDQLERTWGVRLVNRTGVSTGDVVFGEATAGQHVLTGDTMRISSAMEQNSPPLEVLIAEPTFELVRDFVEVEPMAPVTPKGMDVAIPAYRLISVAKREVASESGAAPSSDHRTCSTCGSENEAHSRLCGMCGDSLAARTTARESRKTVTLVFADPKPTSLTDEPPSAEALRDVMSRYFEEMRVALERHGGTVEKFIGDAVMAVYGLPVRHEDDAVRAVRAAADMQAALPALNDSFRQTWGVELRNHIGVNTGEVITGDASTGQRLVTGDAVNTAARLEQAAGPAEIILGDLTYRLAREQIEVEAIPPLTLKGKAEPVPAYRLRKVLDRTAEREAAGAPFVGRTAEMSRLSVALGDARSDGRTRLLTIVGDAGVGKTRLIKEFAAAASSEARVVRGRCLPYGDGITFWPLAEVVRDAAGIAGDDAPDAAIRKITAVVARGSLPERERADVAQRLAAVMGLAPAQFAVAELFWGARRFLESLAHDRPLVMIVDDIHWAERTFLDLLDHVVATAEDAPILLLCSARHQLTERHPEWSETHGGRLIVLEPLSEDDAGLMIGQLLGQAGLDEDIVGRIVSAAEGNPLFVEQMVSLLVDNGTLRREGDRWLVAGAAKDIVVPPTIHALLAARLDDLGEDERDVVEPASIVGLVFARAAIEHLVEDHLRPTIPLQLGSLARKQFVKPDTLDDEPAYRFGHQLIRDTAYGSLLKRERVLLHERFVGWAERINRERGRETEFEEILGYHLEQAYRYRTELGPLDEAGIATGIRASIKLASAGRRALARGDFPAAANLLSRASELRREGDPDRPALLLAAGEALMEIADWASADSRLARAADEAIPHGLDDLRRSAELDRLLLQVRSGATTSFADAMSQALAAIEELAGSDLSVALSRAWRLLTFVYGFSGRYGPCADAAERAIEQARRTGDRSFEMRLYPTVASATLHGPTPALEGIARLREVLDIVGSDRTSVGNILASKAHLEAMSGDLSSARESYRRARATLEELGLKFDSALVSIDSGIVEMMAGDPSAAEAELRRDFDTLESLGERNYIGTTAGILAEALCRQDRYEEAAKYAALCQEIAADDDYASQFLWRGVRGKLAALEGSVDEGISLATSGVGQTRTTDDIDFQAIALMFLAETLQTAGRDREAAETAAEAQALFEAKGNVLSAGQARDFISRIGGDGPGRQPTAAALET